MKQLTEFINEKRGVKSTSTLSNYSSNYDVVQLENFMNNELKGAKVQLDVKLGSYITKNLDINNYVYKSTSNSLLTGFIIECAIKSFLEDNKYIISGMKTSNIDISDNEIYVNYDIKLDGNQDCEIKAFSREMVDTPTEIKINKGITLTAKQKNDIKKSVMILVNYEISDNFAVIKQIFVKHPNQLLAGDTSITAILK